MKIQRISNSAIQCFKSCRRMFELKYVYGLEPVNTSQAIERGLTYHGLIESLLNGDPRAIDCCDNPKVRAMATAFMKYIYPQLGEVAATEEWFSFDTKLEDTSIVGRIDGKTTDGVVIEHKTTSSPIDGAYLQRLDFDEQIPTYMLASGCNVIIYTVCRTPNIRQKKDETEDEFFARCLDWYETDTDEKIALFHITREQSELEEFRENLSLMAEEMQSCKNYYRNPGHCMKWGRMCEYAPVCKHYNQNEDYIQFKKRENHGN